MCRSAAEGGRRCNGRSCGAASARIRQARSRARRGLEAAHAAGDPDRIAAAESKYTAVTGDPPPALRATQETPMPKPEEPTPATTEDRIRAAFQSLATRPRQFVKLADVRNLVGDDITHDQLQETLLSMVRTGTVHLSPDSNRRGLTQADHDAAVTIGREAKHLISIEPDDD